MYKAIILPAILTAITLTARAAEPALPPVQHYELKVNDFTELKVSDPIDVVYAYHPDSVGMAAFEALPEVASAITFTPNGTELNIRLNDDSPRSGLPVVRVYSTYLSKAENISDGKLTVASVQPGAKFKASLQGNGRIVANGLKFGTVEGKIFTGNGTLVLKGNCDVAKLNNTGAGQIEADELVCRESKCAIWGTGSIGIDATGKLSVSGSGSGTLYYKGNPQIKVIAVGIKVKQMQQ